MKKRQQAVGAFILVLTCLVFFTACKRTSASYTSSPPKVILFITIDTLRADHLKSYGYPRDTAPFIDALSAKGITFLSAFSAAPHTAPSHATMFTGLYPFEHNVLRNHETLDPKFITLRSVLEKQGYTVGAVPAVGFLEGKVGFAKEEFPELEPSTEKKFFYKNARDIVERGIAWLGRHRAKENIFLWLHFYDVHQWQGKGNLPKEYQDMFEVDDGIVDFVTEQHLTPISFFKDADGVRKAINGYDRRLKFVDDELKRLNQWLDSNGLGRDVLWVITSDHGEGLGNHNYDGHGQYLYQEQLHVPLIFLRTSSDFPSRRLDQLVRTVDLMPTVVEFSGARIDKAGTQLSGISLLPLIQNGKWGEQKVEHSFAERRPKDQLSFRRFWEEGEIFSLHTQSGKYIEHTNGVDEYFDLESDPFELKNLSPSQLDLEKELSQTVNRLFTRKRGSDSEQELKPEELEELKSLGYL